MTVLQALDAYYDRLDARGEVSSPGWSPEKFGWCIVLNGLGQVVDIQDLRDLSGKKPLLKQYRVPAAIKRTAGIAPNLLWDKTAYVLGRTAGGASARPKSMQHSLTPTWNAWLVKLMKG